MKKDEYINEEFEINPSNKAIFEILPEEKDGAKESLTIDTVTDNEDGGSLANNKILDEDEIYVDASTDNSHSEEEDGINEESDGAPISENDDSEDTPLPIFDGGNVYRETDLFGGEDIPESVEAEDDAEESDIYADDTDKDDESDGFEIEDENGEDANNNETSKADGQTEEAPRRVDSLFDFIELFVFSLAAVFIITSFFFRYSIVDGGSMQNTLQDDEKLILRSIFYTPECGNVVVVQDKSTALKDPIVKRVIAVGGQKVKFTRDAVYVDGAELIEPYVYTGDYENPFGEEDVYRYSVYPSDALLPLVTDRENGVFYEITVPEGEIFVMGDHRNNSKDSRDIGTLHEDAVIGKVVLRFLPFSEFGKIE